MNVRLYARQVGVLLFGNAAAQLVNLASYPALTRLYTPADFGGFALFLTAIGILGPVACARFDIAVQSARNWQLPAVWRQSMRMNLWTAAVTAAALSLYSLATGSIGLDLALLVAAAVLLSGYTLAALALLVRQERYKLYSKSLLVRSATTAVAQIGLWLVLPQALGLILGFCAGFAVQAVILSVALRGIVWRRSTRAHRKAIARRYRRQMATDVPSTLLTGVTINVMTLLLLDLYSRAEVGFYSLAFRVAVLPLALISGSLSEVFFQKAAASYRRTGGFWNEVRLNILSTTAVSLLIFIPMALLARPLFGFAFGEPWVPAADLLVLLAPMLAIRFVSSSIQTAPLVVGRASWLLAQNIGLLAAIGAAFLLAKSESLAIDSYVLLTSLLMAAAYGGFLLFVAVTVRRRFRSAAGVLPIEAPLSP